MSSDVDLSPGHVWAAAAALEGGRASVGSSGGLGPLAGVSGDFSMASQHSVRGQTASSQTASHARGEGAPRLSARYNNPEPNSGGACM